ncbi:PQQ-dependent sugar dehydrogenase, partial [Fibrobacterota bacterium]
MKPFSNQNYLPLVQVMAGLAIASLFFISPAMAQCPEPAPEDFQVTVLHEGDLNAPSYLAVAQDAIDGRVFVTDMTGEIWMHTPGSDSMNQIGSVTTAYDEADGLSSIAVHPEFPAKPWIYLLYSKNTSLNRRLALERYDLVDGSLDMNSVVSVLEIPRHLVDNHNSGGGMVWDRQGNLYIGIGDNADANDSINDGYAALYWPDAGKDAQGTAANTADLRGKILRIHPEDDGTYTIPQNNFGEVFAQFFAAEPARAAQYLDTALVRPEIYAMGCRNPFRLGINNLYGWVSWGDLGPEAQMTDLTRGPMGYDELNLARNPGFFGWPYAIGNNLAYQALVYDASGNLSPTSAPFPIEAGINTSANNTGIKDYPLPPAQAPVIWYADNDNNESVFFMGVGGGEAAMSGPWYHWSPDVTGPQKFPAYFNNKLIFWDWERPGNVKLLSFDANGVHTENTQWLIKTDGSAGGVDHFWGSPIAMEFGPDGALYVLKFSNSGYDGTTSQGARMLYRIDYVGTQYEPSLCGVVVGCTDPGYVEYNSLANAHDQSQCITETVGIERQTPGRPVPQHRLVTNLDFISGVKLSEGVQGFDLFNLQGVKLWSYRKGEKHH